MTSEFDVLLLSKKEMDNRRISMTSHIILSSASDFALALCNYDTRLMLFKARSPLHSFILTLSYKYMYVLILFNTELYSKTFQGFA